MWKTFMWKLDIIVNHYHEIESVTQRCLALVHKCFPNVSIVHVPQSRKDVSAYCCLNIVVCILTVSVKKSNFGYIQFKAKQFSTINTHTTEKNSGCLHYAVSIKHLIWVSKCLLTFVYDHTYTLSWGITAQTALQFKASL